MTFWVGVVGGGGGGLINGDRGLKGAGVCFLREQEKREKTFLQNLLIAKERRTKRNNQVPVST